MLTPRRLPLLFAALFCALLVTAQEKAEFVSPLNIPLYLSGNFGELRPNHFHGGLDMKTQGVEGKEVLAVADGYISRVSVAPGGYGNAIYITHPNGYTSVYGHLQRFNEKLAAYVRRQQQRQESWEVNIFLTASQFPVKQGDLIALSGNTGGSGGPHLHLEIRKTDTNEPIDPMQCYLTQLADTRPPRASAVMFYPQRGAGSVNGSTQKSAVEIASATALARPVTAWGDIALGIKAYDYMDNTSNIYGVLSVTLYVDDREVFRSEVEKFSFDENRAINGWTDYEEYVTRKSWFMRSHLTRGARLRLLRADAKRGILRINEERDYHIRYVLRDRHGNTARYQFVIRGEEQPISAYQQKGKYFLRCDQANAMQEEGMHFVIRKGMLYDDVDAETAVFSDSTAIADTYQLHSFATPLHAACPIAIAIRRPVAVDNTKYYLAQKVGAALYYAGGNYEAGWMKGEIRELGTYTVAVDTIPPRVEPLNRQAWRQTGEIAFRLTDDETGIAKYKAKVDGVFVPFAYNLKRRLSCKLSESGIPQTGSNHSLVLTVTDNRGNTTVVTENIYY